MTDFDFGSVYGSVRHAKPSLFATLLGRIADMRARKTGTADSVIARDKAPTDRNDRGYLADIGMEVGF